MRKSLLLMPAVLLLASCGVYTPAPVILPSHIKAISVSRVQNRTPAFGLEDDFDRRLRDEFIRDGRIAVTNDADADGSVDVVLSRYILEPISYDSNHVVEEYKIVVYCDFKFVDRVQNRVLWEEKNFEGRHRFFVQTKPGGLTEDEARLYVWDNLSRDIVKRTIEGFGSITGTSQNRVPQNLTEE